MTVGRIVIMSLFRNAVTCRQRKMDHRNMAMYMGVSLRIINNETMQTHTTNSLNIEHSLLLCIYLLQNTWIIIGINSYDRCNHQWKYRIDRKGHFQNKECSLKVFGKQIDLKSLGINQCGLSTLMKYMPYCTYSKKLNSALD